MKKVLKIFFAKMPLKSVSFSARSAMIASSLLASGRAFSGGGPSGQVPPKQVAMTEMQLQAVKILINEKILTPQIDDYERAMLENLLQKIETTEVKTVEDSQQ
jgi:hypothetical protein